LVVLIVVLLAGSGVLALAETSLVRTSRVKAKALSDDGRHGARALARLVERPERFLNPVLLLVLVCQLISATLIGVLAAQWFGALGVLFATIFEVVVVFVFFEAVPKNWAVRNPERAALFSAPMVEALVRFPPVRVTSSALIGLANLIIGRRADRDASDTSNVTESELLAMADVAHAEEVIETEERAFIHSIIDFGDTIVREVMVPRPDMVTLESHLSVSEALRQALAAGYSRLPVYVDNIDDVVGIAHAKDLMQAEHEARGGDRVGDHVRNAHFVPETKHVGSMLTEMQERKFHLAIVVDEYGGTVGLVSMEDLIEELVGEIVDEFDVEEPAVEHLPSGGLVVAGRMSVDDAAELLGAQLPEGGWDSIGGLMLDLTGRVPDQGESVLVDGYRLVAERVQGRRIARVRIEPASSEANGT
jgi:putative hemolysin